MTSGRVILDDALVQRACSEFTEMPGLRLTCPQAQRLWGLDHLTCLALLEYLVTTRFLYRPAHGMYGRPTELQAAHPRPRMATATLDSGAPPRAKQAV